MYITSYRNEMKIAAKIEKRVTNYDTEMSGGKLVRLKRVLPYVS